MPPKMPKVETFEHNIAEEIKRKDAILSQLDVNQKDVAAPVILPHKTPTLLIALITTSTICIFAILGIIYFYLHDSLLPPSSAPVPVYSNDIPKVAAPLGALSPTLASQIGLFVTGVEKKEQGYVLTINAYSPVFAYITKNESSYVEELLLTFYGDGTKNIPVATSTTPNQDTTKISATSTTSTTTKPVTGTATSTQQLNSASTTKVVATSTKTTTTKTQTKSTTKTSSTTQVVASSESTNETVILSSSTLQAVASNDMPDKQFTDVTLENQNMRVYTKDKKTIVYSFLGDTTLLISNSPEGILLLKNAILRK